MTEVASVSAGKRHTMILKTNGDLWAVGRNAEGQLGDGTTTRRLNPVQVMEKAPGGGTTAMIDVASVSAGTFHTMILKENGELWAVGRNRMGQLADGTTNNTMTPKQVMTAVAQVSVSCSVLDGGHTMIVVKDGTLLAVGSNQYGQLGKGRAASVLGPDLKQPMTAVAQVSVGNIHTMILKKDDTLWAVGSNKAGQLGNGKSGANAKELIPVEITVE